MKAVIDALNVVYEEKEKRGFIKLNLVSLAFTVGAILRLTLLSGAAVSLGPGSLARHCTSGRDHARCDATKTVVFFDIVETELF
jgi:uncharacterized BrkB/YihY/UPF0761 family membrane protein